MALSGRRIDLTSLKASVSLKQLAESAGLELTRRGRSYWACCPFHAERSASFHLDEAKGFFHCFGCGAHGSAIDFVMRIERCDFAEAVRRLAGDGPLPSIDLAELARREQARAAQEAADRAQRRKDAAALWAAGRPIQPGDLADRYLIGRGLSGPWPPSLRQGWCLSKADQRWPALVAGVTRWPDRHVVAVQLTPLAEPGVKAWERPARLTRGDYKTGAVRLSPWRHGQPILVTEGTEDGLAVIEAAPGATVWAILGTDNGPLMLLPKGAEAILVLDGDRAGRWAAARTADALVERGHPVRIVDLPPGLDPLDRWLVGRAKPETA